MDDAQVLKAFQEGIDSILNMVNSLGEFPDGITAPVQQIKNIINRHESQIPNDMLK